MSAPRGKPIGPWKPSSAPPVVGTFKKRTLGEAVLAGDARAWGRIADLVRERGGTYADAREWVREIFRKAGKPEPTDAEFEDKMMDAEDLESRG